MIVLGRGLKQELRLFLMKKEIGEILQKEISMKILCKLLLMILCQYIL